MKYPLESSDFDLMSSLGMDAQRTSRREFYDDPEDYKEALIEAGLRNANNAFEHELAHVNTAVAVGITAAKHGVERYGWRDRKTRAITYLGAYVGIPRLALAAVALAPIGFSDADQRFAASLGYKDIYYGFPDKIRAWNDNQPLQIPMPSVRVSSHTR